MQPLVLASSSSRRKALLKQIGVPFIVDPSNIDETADIALSPEELVEQLALSKAQAAISKHPHSIILGADTIVVIEGEILGKPHDETTAKYMLQKLSGKTHQVVTGLSIIDTDQQKELTKHTTTKVTMKQLSLEEIERYIATKEPLDKAGAYGIQERGALLVKEIMGDFTNVVGLPIPLLTDMLKELGISLL